MYSLRIGLFTAWPLKETISAFVADFDASFVRAVVLRSWKVTPGYFKPDQLFLAMDEVIVVWF